MSNRTQDHYDKWRSQLVNELVKLGVAGDKTDHLIDTSKPCYGYLPPDWAACIVEENISRGVDVFGSKEPG